MSDVESNPRNEIVLFSNGIADVRRRFALAAGESRTISLPVRKQDLGDILASLCVFGDVRLSQPPGYRNDDNTPFAFDLDTSEAFESILKNLAGTNIDLETTSQKSSGTLLGIDIQDALTDGGRKQNKSAVVMASGQIQRIPFAEITSLRFADESIQSEVDRLLERKRQAIRPEATLLELALTANDSDSVAMLQYTVPVAAWKIAYRLHIAEESCIFEGYAVVDNTSEEDWNDFDLTVVTGDPITFRTNLAEASTPERSFVPVVQEKAFGASELRPAAPKMMIAGRSGMMADDQFGAVDSMMMEFDGDEEVALASSMTPNAPAQMNEMELETVGDFCLYHSTEPVSVSARGSAIVQLFRRELPESNPVLHYLHSYHPSRPTRTVELVNETDQSLPRGACTVFMSETYAGSCVVPLTPPGRTVYLPHAVESAVHVLREIRTLKQKLVGVELSRGMYIVEENQRQRIEYRITNNRNEPATLVLDHQRQLSIDATYQVELASGNEIVPVAEPEVIESGRRFRITLPARSLSIFQVNETDRKRTTVQLLLDLGMPDMSLDPNAFGRLRNRLLHIRDEEKPVAEMDDVRALIELHNDLNDAEDELREANERKASLERKTERLQENIRVSRSSQQGSKWEQELAEVTDAITLLEEKTLPELQQNRNDALKLLSTTISETTLSWKNQAD